MPALDRLVQNTAMTADEIGRLRKAYELTLSEIGMKKRSDPLTERIAKEIVEVGTGVTDPAEISRLAVERLRL